MANVSNNKDFPQMIKNYRIKDLIGRGGMGEVYLAVHPTLKRDIILKSLLIKDKESQERFLREAQVMIDFRHENIVQVYDHFKEGRATYIAMEFVNGKDLNRIIREREKEFGSGKIPVPLALFILYQAALGLHHAHIKGVIHRDIKPHNILISVNGDVKLTDFGIAAKKNEEKDLTATGTIVGTPAYMSPEQFSGNRELTYQSDIYSLGVVFYEMITGIRPFKNEYSAEVLSAISNGRYDSPSKYVKNLPPIVKKIIKKTFNPDIKKRYKNLIPLLKLLKSYFKKYNIFEIKDSIRRLVLRDKKLLESSFFQKFYKYEKLSLRLKIFNLLFIFVTLFLILFFGTNRQYEWILRWKYGKVILEFEKKNMDENNIYILIDNKVHKAIIKEEKFRKEFYLKEGIHKFTIRSGSYINRKEIYVYPLSVQKKYNDMINGQICRIPIANLWSQDVALYLRFWDYFNPNNLLLKFDNYTVAKFKDQFNDFKKESDNLKLKTRSGRYILLKEYIESEIKSNRSPFYSGYTYSFKIENFSIKDREYFDKEFSLKFELEDRSVVTHLYLVVKPAKIVITSNVKKLNIFLNDLNSGFIFQNNQYKNLPYNSIKPKKIGDKYVIELFVPPNRYSFRINNEKPKIINLASNSIIDIDVKKENDRFIY
ncbi:MAG TPA: serine/threonine-protein kinase [Spirochaetota bacterium]|nr:serine/threonine-protein kinase [Spirochaetota bacterium]HOL57154.1 serine/threonine-protein kinase [Spirochaetota bacterium]HPP04747.1 serine/threonine-protein kinase [Spirochaetota bacterium]